MGNRHVPLDERFWSQVDRTEGCWLWTGMVKRRYGMISVNNRQVRTHRLSWEMHNGPIPEGMYVLHHCDTPLCVRPDHLYIGTHADNMRDRHDRRRQANARKTHCIRGHPLTGRHLYIDPGRGSRICRTCKALKERERVRAPR